MDKSNIDNIARGPVDKKKVIESVLEQPLEKRVAKLVELGVLKDLEGYTWGNIFDRKNTESGKSFDSSRFFVVANVNGVPIPMYKSFKHTADKREDLNFFAFFGVMLSDHWVIKGKGTNEFYGVKRLEEISYILTQAFDFYTSRWKKSGDIVSDGYVPEGREVVDYIKLNELLGRRFSIDFLKLDVNDDEVLRNRIINEKIVSKIGGEFK